MKFVYPMAGLVTDLISSVESCTDVYGLKVVGNTTGRGLLAHAAGRITVRPDSQTREGHGAIQTQLSPPHLTNLSTVRYNAL